VTIHQAESNVNEVPCLFLGQTPQLGSDDFDGKTSEILGTVFLNRFPNFARKFIRTRYGS
jgi:hypothetical protein